MHNSIIVTGDPEFKKAQHMVNTHGEYQMDSIKRNRFMNCKTCWGHVGDVMGILNTGFKYK